MSASTRSGTPKVPSGGAREPFERSTVCLRLLELGMLERRRMRKAPQLPDHRASPKLARIGAKIDMGVESQRLKEFVKPPPIRLRSSSLSFTPLT